MSDKLTIIEGEQNIRNYRTLALRARLKLEIKGLKFRGRTTYAMVKSEFGFKGNKARVLEQLNEYIEQNILL